jgi:integrase
MAGLTQAEERIFDKKASSNSGKSEHVHGSAGASPSCPQCGSAKVWRDGLRYSPFGDKIQRWLCRDCGLRFSDPEDIRDAWSTFERVERIDTKSLKSGDDKVTTRQICVTETKNLVAEQKTMEVPRRSEVDIKGAIVEFLWQLKKENRSEDTITAYGYSLETLVKRGVNLFDPENFKDVMARQTDWTETRKHNLTKAYRCFLNQHGIKATLTKYRVTRKLPFIPTEEEINQLIASGYHQMATLLQTLKETAARIGEAWKLEWDDLDTEAKTLNISHPEKGCNPRKRPISAKLMTMLLSMPKTNKRIFTYKSRDVAGKTFRALRKRAARNLGNPRLLKIHFHTFRHWKATMEYHKTKDLIHVMQILGHKSLRYVLIYTQLIDIPDEGYTCKAAKTIQEASQLIEGGFEYVTEMEGYKLFRKRK